MCDVLLKSACGAHLSYPVAKQVIRYVALCQSLGLPRRAPLTATLDSSNYLWFKMVIGIGAVICRDLLVCIIVGLHV